jgi:hypothetical protein
MAAIDNAEILEEEAFLIETSGEIPEVAFHAAVHHLVEDPEGPRLDLGPAEIHRLKGGVLAGYRRILLRDLDPDNRDQPHFRGLERAAANWNRLSDFAEREGLDASALRRDAADALVNFLRQAAEDVAEGRPAGLRAGPESVPDLIAGLRVDQDQLPSNWPELVLEDRL